MKTQILQLGKKNKGCIKEKHLTILKLNESMKLNIRENNHCHVESFNIYNHKVYCISVHVKDFSSFPHLNSNINTPSQSHKLLIKNKTTQKSE